MEGLGKMYKIRKEVLLVLELKLKTVHFSVVTQFLIDVTIFNLLTPNDLQKRRGCEPFKN
jgi:hypothetical protein